MTITNHDDWSLSERGKKDAERHQEKIDESIRKNIGDVIAEESIITKKRGRKIRVPVRGLRDYRFIYGNDGDGGAGIGQGDGKDGDIIDQKQKGKGQNEPGSEEGDWMEAEVDIDYLINIMFDDLGLPWIEEKTKKENLVPKGWKFENISKKGILPRLHKKRTIIEAVKRMAAYIGEIVNDTGCSEDDANKALFQSNGDIDDAIKIIKSGIILNDETSIFIDDDDLRFKQIEQDVELHSNAVVIAMMDVSYSMSQEKRYLARSMLFWMTEFLRKMYDNVEIKFIQHTTVAEVVDEDKFFRTQTTGGTECWTAFDKANYMIDTEYPTDEWNVYCIYMSDGEDFNPNKTVSRIKMMLDKKISMLSYCEIDVDDGYGPSPYKQLLNKIKESWKFHKTSNEGTEFYKNEQYRFLMSIIKDKSHIFPALKHMLFEKRKK